MGLHRGGDPSGAAPDARGCKRRDVRRLTRQVGEVDLDSHEDKWYRGLLLALYVCPLEASGKRRSDAVNRITRCTCSHWRSLRASSASRSTCT
jgi:hypothetical protein